MISRGSFPHLCNVENDVLISSGNGRLVGLRVVQAPAVKFQGCLTIVFCTTFVS